MHTSLDSNKSEKQQKEAFRVFFAAAGFQNVSSGADLKLSAATVVTGARMRERGHAASDQDAIQWPDLHDIDIPP
jgi:hypothetical protein